VVSVKISYWLSFLVDADGAGFRETACRRREGGGKCVCTVTVAFPLALLAMIVHARTLGTTEEEDLELDWPATGPCCCALLADAMT